MRWFIFSVALLIQSSFAQVAIQGTVTASGDPTAPIIDATVQFSRLDVTGLDTLRVLLGAVHTDQIGRFSYLLATDVEKTDRNVPQKFALSSSYPNPFQTKTQVTLNVPKSDNFSIAVYNILGQEIARVDKLLSSGSYSIQWDGSATPGVYFVAVRAGGEMTFIKLLQLNKNSGSSALRVTGLAGAFQTKVTTTPGVASTSSVQVTVSKPRWETYVSPPLTYSAQTLDIPLSYFGSGPISGPKRDSAMTQTASQFRSLMGRLSKSEAAKTMADWLRKQPQFEDAGAADDGNVWCRFTDGTMAIFANNFQIGDTSNPIPGKMLPLPRYKRTDVLPSEIPVSNSITLYSSFGSAFLLPAAHVDLVSAYAGYKCKYIDNIGISKSNVESLETEDFQDAGLFCAFGHGGSGVVPTGGTEFAVWTCTERSDYYDKKFADDLKEHRLVWMYALYDIDYSTPGKDSTFKWNYAFTGQFVRKYMTFGKNSLVLIGACSSATNNAFVNAFLDRGASVFAGFTATAYADYLRASSMYLLDRAMGANFRKIIKYEDPPQRPFDLSGVLSWMQDNQYDYGAADGSSKLTLVYKTGSKLGPLAPSIVTMSLHPYDQKLYIYGMFGENPGSKGIVTIGSSPSQVLEWAYDGTTQMDRIVCKIPDDGPGSYGDVQVKVRGIESNITQLSRYKGAFTLRHETTDGRQYEVKLTLQFRAHLQGFRMKPGEKPMFNQPTFAVFADMGSTGEHTATGSTGGQIFWSGHSTDLHNNIDGAANPRSFEAGAWFDPEKMKMQLYMSGGIENGIIQTVGSTSTPTHLIFGLDTFDGKNGFLPSYVEIPLQSTFSIVKGSVSAKQVATYYSAMFPMADQVKIEWDNITCESPPKKDAAR